MEKINDGGPAFPVPDGDYPQHIVDRFWSWVEESDDQFDCWPWRGARTRGGYGIFSLGHRKQVRAHRFAFHVSTGLPPGEMILHTCDNRACCNPRHLQSGDHGENMRQMAERRRAAREERHHKAKLSFNEAAAIALLNAGGDYTTDELAKMFGVCKATAICAASGVNWPDAKAAADAMIKARESSNG